MARRADQELNDQASSTSWLYQDNTMDMLKQHWVLVFVVVVVLLVIWKYGMKK
jgi:hypothetical protein